MDLIRNNTENVKTLKDVLRIQSNTIPESVAVIYKNQEFTYGYLHRLVVSTVNHILSNSTSISSVGTLLPRGINYIVAYFASAELGVKLVPINYDASVDEINSTIDYCDVDILLYDTDTEELINNIKEVKCLKMGMDSELLESLGRTTLETHISPSDIAILLHTSGSTSEPKRVMLTHENIICNARSHALHMKLYPKDKVLIVIPMSFGYCNTAQIITHLLLGSTLVVLDGMFAPQKFFKLVDKYEINVCTLVPTMLHQIVSFKHFHKYNTSHLHQITFGGSPFSKNLIKKAMEVLPNTNFCATYGLTEAGPRITGASPEATLNGSSGTPIPSVKVRILNEHKQPVTDEEIGEIYVKSPGIMKGYYQRDDETKKVMINGWLNSGDLGKWVDGNLFIVGRIKNVIIRAGVNIYPEELESYFKKHSGIKDVYVKGQHHSILGEIPHALVLRNDENLTQNDLKAFAQKGLSNYKIPSFEFVKSFSYTYNNKIKRR